MEIRLDKPIQLGSETVDKLEMREPTAAELRKLGDPVTVLQSDGGSTAPVIDNETVAQYLSVLCAVPPSTINRLSIKDFYKARAALMSFFV